MNHPVIIVLHHPLGVIVRLSGDNIDEVEDGQEQDQEELSRGCLEPYQQEKCNQELIEVLNEREYQTPIGEVVLYGIGKDQ